LLDTFNFTRSRKNPLTVAEVIQDTDSNARFAGQFAKGNSFEETAKHIIKQTAGVQGEESIMNFMAMNPGYPACFAIMEKVIAPGEKSPNIHGLVKRNYLTLAQLNDFQSLYPKGVSYIQPLPLHRKPGDKRLKPEIYSVVVELT
jgi:hypothetical protein